MGDSFSIQQMIAKFNRKIAVRYSGLGVNTQPKVIGPSKRNLKRFFIRI